VEQTQADYQSLRERAKEASTAKHWKEATELWAELCLMPMTMADDFQQFGHAALAAGLFERATVVLETGLSRFPDNIWIGRLWGLAAKWPRDFTEAARRFALVRNKGDSDLLAADHVDCLSELGQFAEAEQIITLALERFPKSRWVNLAWMRIAVRQHNAAEVEARWKIIDQHVPAGRDCLADGLDRHLLQEKISSMFEAGAYRAAAPAFRRLESNLPEHSIKMGPPVVGVVLLRDPLVVVSAVYSFESVVRPIMEFRHDNKEAVFFFFGSNMSLVFHHELRERLPKQFHDLSKEFPNAHITFMVNEVDELAIAKSLGMRAVLVNNNAFIDIEEYNILPEAEKVYDAVYNARFHPYKRHELALRVENLRLVMTGPKIWAWEGVETDIRTLFPNTEINERELNSGEVVAALNSARCGLCLSSGEGAMYAAIEYLLCGLPVVTTWNVGGRDWWFSGDYAIWCDPDPDEIASAVRTIIDRKIPPQHVRETAVQRIRREQVYFKSVVRRTLDENGFPGRNIEAAFSENFSDKANYNVRPLGYFLHG
jgi:glycosyltransferase involved in cell wall biosynthesis